MMMKPSTRPIKGEVIMGTITFHQSPLPSHQCCVDGTDQIMTFQSLWAAASAAPQRPPTSAWLELEGSPNHQVSRFQKIAPISEQMRISEDTASIWTNPDEMVLATAVPAMAPRRFVVAARTTAWRGFRTFVDTTVAMELAVSWKPLMYSKINATRMTIRISVMQLHP